MKSEAMHRWARWGGLVLLAGAIPLSAAQPPAATEFRAPELLPDWDATAAAAARVAEHSSELSESQLQAQQADHEIAQSRAAGRVSVLVHFETQAADGFNHRPAIRDFASNHGGVVKHEYHTAMPNVMNLRDIPEDQVAALRELPGVWKVEIDQYYPNLVNLHDSIPLIRGLQSQVTGAGYVLDGSGVRICIVDTGIDSDHIMYAERIDSAAGYDFYNDDPNPEDDHGHGSHCAGIAAGRADIGWDPCGTGWSPLQGVAPNATLISAKVLNSAGGGFNSDIIAGIDYCADQSASGGRADVISMSIGSGGYAGPCSHGWAVAANNAAANGVVAVAAAGNNNFANALSSPACGADVIAVGMTWKNDYPTCEDPLGSWNWGICTDFTPETDDVGCFSNESDYLDVAAPGANIWSASIAAGGTTISGSSGTSMSCPTVAGLAALLLQADPALTPAEVRQLIRDGAIDMGPAGFDRGFGWGRIDVLDTLALVVPSCTTDPECDDGNSCTTDACVEGSCQYTNTADSCDDGLFCTAVDTCASGACVGSGDPCAGGLVCNEASNSCDDIECLADEDCADGSDCTTDSCTAGICTNSCSAGVSSYPHFEGFEAGTGEWSNAGGDDFDWSRDSNGTPSSTTGPSGDHTTGSGWYMYTETSYPRQPGDTAILEGPCYELAGGSGAHLTFWYHMFGAAIGTLEVEVTTDCMSWTTAWSLSGNQGNSWFAADVDLSAYDGATVTVRFVGTRGSSWAGDIAIDDVVMDLSSAGCAVDDDCTDGLYCNGVETCAGGTCTAGTPVNCDDGVACTDDACDEAAESCDHETNHANCDDGAFCNGAEFCDAVDDCQAGTDVDCNDGVGCTVDSCNEDTTSCDHDPDDEACGDDAFCNGVEFCHVTADCQAGVAPDCSDGVGCTDDACNEVADTCDHFPNNTTCDDEVYCNGAESCHVINDCQAGSDPCPGEVCQEGTQTCVGCQADGDCDDLAFCNGAETCNAGACQAGTAVECDDGVGCTVDSCNEVSDSCDNLADHALCDDSEFCSGVETCDIVDDCQPGSDPCGGEPCDESSDTCASGSAELWMSFRSTLAVPGVGAVSDEDIVAYTLSSGTWSLIFDGSDVGVAGLEIDGLAVLDDGDILMSFTTSGTVPGLVGGPSGTGVDDSDIVMFTPSALGASTTGTFTFFFDGSDVGLSSSAEDIDGLALADDGRLVVSTSGTFSAAGASGSDEDLFIFSDTSLGAATAGSFAQYFDGSDVGLSQSSSEDVDAASLTTAGSILLSTIGNFSVSGTSGADEDVLEFLPTSLGSATSGSYMQYLDLSALGISSGADVGALFLLE